MTLSDETTPPEHTSGTVHGNAPTNHAREQRHTGQGIVWAVFLIFLGVLLMLNTSGVVPWGIWTSVWRFWPLLLILGGIQILFGEYLWGRIVVGLIALLLFAGIIFLILLAQNIGWAKRIVPFGSDTFLNLVTTQVGGPIHDTLTVANSEYPRAEKQHLSVKTNEADFHIIGQSSGENYLVVTTNHYKNFGQAKLTSSLRDGVIFMNLEEQKNTALQILGTQHPLYEIVMGDQTYPTTLDLTLGAARGDVDARALTLDALTANVGAGELNVTLGKRYGKNPTLDIDLGTGSSHIRIPSDVGYKVTYNIGVGSVTVNGTTTSGLGKSNSSYESSNYTTAENSVIIRAKVGVGSLTINQENFNE
jgi:predicted membrane protein